MVMFFMSTIILTRINLISSITQYDKLKKSVLQMPYHKKNASVKRNKKVKIKDR